MKRRKFFQSLLGMFAAFRGAKSISRYVMGVDPAKPGSDFNAIVNYTTPDGVPHVDYAKVEFKPYYVSLSVTGGSEGFQSWFEREQRRLTEQAFVFNQWYGKDYTESDMPTREVQHIKVGPIPPLQESTIVRTSEDHS